MKQAMNLLEQEIIDKFHQLDTVAKKRLRALIERETEAEISADALSEDRQSWLEFINATYGSMADDPMDEIDNSKLPPPVRDEVE